MSGDMSSLMQQAHDYFLSLFQQHSDSTPGSTFLSFEPIGTTITQDMFKLHSTDATYSPELAVEQFSSLVNTIPDINADAFQRTDKLVDDFYQILLVGSLPVDSNNTLFSTIKAQAVQKFEPTLGSLLESLTRFHPSYATPNDWYDPGSDGNWPTYTFNSGQSNSAGGGIPPPLLHPIRPWNWRVLPDEAKPALENQQLLAGYVVNSERAASPSADNTMHLSPELRAFAHTEMTPIAESATHISTEDTHASLATLERDMLVSPTPAIERSALASSTPVEASIAATPITAVEETFVTTPNSIATLQPRLLATELTPLILKYTSTQSVTSNTLSVSFKYCLINIDRPWFSQAFLNLLNWYVSGYQAGMFSSGTVENNTGVFPTLPIACLVVKDLQITAQWTEEDVTVIQRAAAFGPFSLVGRTVDSNSSTLIRKDMQTIGWICQVMPLLAPVSVPPQP